MFSFLADHPSHSRAGVKYGHSHTFTSPLHLLGKKCDSFIIISRVWGPTFVLIIVHPYANLNVFVIYYSSVRLSNLLSLTLCVGILKRFRLQSKIDNVKTVGWGSGAGAKKNVNGKVRCTQLSTCLTITQAETPLTLFRFLQYLPSYKLSALDCPLCFNVLTWHCIVWLYFSCVACVGVLICTEVPPVSAGDTFQDLPQMPETAIVANPIYKSFFIYIHTYDKV